MNKVKELEEIFEALWKRFRPSIKRVIVEGPGISHDWDFLSEEEKENLLIEEIGEIVRECSAFSVSKV